VPVNRLLYEGDLVQGSQLRLEGDEAHHLSRVLRARQGDAVEVINGRNQLAQGTVEALGRGSVDILVREVITEPPLQPQLILAQALPKPNRLDTIIEKATELGAHQIHLFPAERSEVPQLKAQQRVASIIRSAVKQCGRLDLPELLMRPALRQWDRLPAPLSYFGDLRPEALSFQKAWKQPTSSVAFFVGPEGGLTENEIRQLDKLGARGVRLHPHVLRADTAPIVALGLMAHWLWE
jgi:16S rRNA (uracil1498-N3)-methyltransferase